MTDLVRREAIIDAGAEAVWEAVTGDGWLADEVAIEPWTGGSARFCTGDEQRDGWVEDFARGQRLAFWWAAGDEPASRVELTLEPLEDGRTRVLVIETRPLDLLDLVATPLPGAGRSAYGPALLAVG